MRFAAVLLALLSFALAAPAAAQTVSQTIPLHPGWNAIWLEVQPDPPAPNDPACDEPGEELSPACVFLGLPVASVWHYAPSIGAATFISNPGVDDLVAAPDWLGWFPQTSEQSMLTTLDEIRVNRAYLVNLSGADPRQLTLSGRPALARFRWAPDAFTLTGFPVAPASPTTFGQFFAGSAAHAEAVDDGLIYRLSGSGVWEPVLDADLETIQAGIAYWVFTRGGSEHQGPLEVIPPLGDGIDFGRALSESSLEVRKVSPLAGDDIRFELLASASPVALSYRSVEPIDAQGSPQTVCAPTSLDFPASNVLTLPKAPCEGGAAPALGPDDSVVLRLGAVRRDFAADDVASVLAVSNGAGIRRLVPVSASRPPAEGLWIGEVRIREVSQSNRAPQDMSFDLQLAGVTDDVDGANALVETPALMIGTRQTWEYWQMGPKEPRDDDEGDHWTDLAYDTAGVGGWSSGRAEFGFGDGGDPGQLGTPLDPTPIPLVPGSGEPDRTAPAFLRHSFTLPSVCSGGTVPDGTACTANNACGAGGLCSAASFDHLDLSIVADDGAVVYLNGSEIARVNLAQDQSGSAASLRPLGPVSGDAEAFLSEVALPAESFTRRACAEPGFPVCSADADCSAGVSCTAQAGLLGLLDPSGTNVLAVSLHQYEFASVAAGEETPLEPVDPPFDFRLIVHVAEGSPPQATLLKEVVQMRNPDDNVPVLLVDDELIPSFNPMTLVDGRPVGFRVSTAAYDFVGSHLDFAASGAFGTADATLTVTIDDPYDGPTNPFRHGFHPDHDNKDADGHVLPEGVESYDVSRALKLTFTSVDPDLVGLASPEDHLDPAWGSDLVGGFYEETLTGLHKDPIRVRGTFHLRRADDTPTLTMVAP